MVAAPLAFILATAAMVAGLEPFATWYYSFAWWSYILFCDAWLSRHYGRASLILNRDAPRLMGLSVVIWVSFEVYNFRLHNWHYVELPSEAALRWAGYAVAYATVLPGVLVTWNLLRAIGSDDGSTRGKPLPASLAGSLLWGGLAASILPWLWPRYCFPLVWLGPTAFFSAINHRLGGEGILADLERNGPAKLYRLLGAGGLCGLLWELWNFWARSKWVYDVPFFDWLHLFEMPLAGFLGFLPFAVECHEMYWAARKALDRIKRRELTHVATWAVLTAYVAASFWGIDRFTVTSFQR